MRSRHPESAPVGRIGSAGEESLRVPRVLRFPPGPDGAGGVALAIAKLAGRRPATLLSGPEVSLRRWITRSASQDFAFDLTGPSLDWRATRVRVRSVASTTASDGWQRFARRTRRFRNRDQQCSSSPSFSRGRIWPREQYYQFAGTGCVVRLPRATAKPHGRKLAEGVGFEPTVPAKGTTVFETAPFDHSGTPPRGSAATATYRRREEAATPRWLANPVSTVPSRQPPGVAGISTAGSPCA